MSVFAIMLLLTVVLALMVGAVVAIGMQGLWRDRTPRLAKGLAKTAQHLNGEAKPPSMLDDLLTSSRS